MNVILGATRFHAIDEAFTAAFNDSAFLELARETRKRELDSRRKPRDFHEEWADKQLVADALIEFKVERGNGAWPWYYVSRFVDRFEPGWAVPLCGMIDAGPAVPIEVAEARGFTWSRECAKKLGLIDDGRPPLARVTWRGSRRAYMHAIDCETCLLEGIQRCEIFPLIAKEEIDSDVDPRLDPEHDQAVAPEALLSTKEMESSVP